MVQLVLCVLCVLLLTTCAGTVSSDKSQGKTVQQLGDDPPCGTPVECYAQAIEALKEAEQKIAGLNNAILTLNQTIKEMMANQRRMNATIATLNTAYSCNCTYSENVYTPGGCDTYKVSRGFIVKSQSQTQSSVGNWCCDVCVGTPKEAAEYARTHPLPHPPPAQAKRVL